jgi:tRNA threonylcarbamoyladenosine biosynthesis protein TsaB
LGASVTDGDVTLSEKILPPGKRHLENFPDLVSDVLSSAGVTLKDVDAFAAAIGPGSFSGVRIGLAAVKGYCLALNKPLIGISSLDILISQAAFDSESALAVIDAGRGDVYVGHSAYMRDQRPILQSAVIVARQEFANYARSLINSNPVICGGEVIGQLGLDSHTADLRLVEAPFPSTCGFLAHRRLMDSDVDDVMLITPVYMRKSDAEEKLTAKSGN